MKNATVYAAIALLAGLILAFSINTDKELKSKLENLSGTYSDAAPYPYGNAWGKRVFTFENGRWTLRFTLALDPEMKMQIFEFRTLGTYQLQDKSRAAANTYNAVFFEEKKFLTLLSGDENLINAFGFAPCNLTKGIEQDISITGCSAWKPVADCPGDYDLLSMDNKGNLYFGQRPTDNDMCSPEKRPATLTPPVTKL